MTKVSLQKINQEDVRAEVESVLKRVIKDGADRARHYDLRYGRLWDAMYEVCLAGGKRLRPYLTVVSYSAFGGSNPAIYQAGAAQELLHMSLLIHDDIMDRDYIRHGRKNLSGTYLEYYSGLKDDVHLAESAALLAGDLLIAAAYEQIAMSDFGSTERIQAIEIFGRGVHEVAGGQLLDMEAAGIGGDADEYLTVARLKTAGYSFVSPLMIGGALAGAPQSQLAVLEELGIALGIGFQLADDLLGLFGDEADTGKSALSDVREGKATYLMRVAYTRCSPPDRDWLAATLGRPDVTVEDLNRVREIVTQCGARAETEAMLAGQGEKAGAALKRLEIESGARASLSSFIAQSLWRKS